MTILHLDFESFAHRDLRKVGAWNYVHCPHFEVTVMAWAFDDGPVRSLSWPATKTLPYEIKAHLDAHGAARGMVHAWNAAFEHIILTEHYGVWVLPQQMSCTMQRALAFGLPGALADAGPALGLAIIKDKVGQMLMYRMGKPKKDGSTWHATNAAKLTALEAYCQRDVEAEREIGRHVPMLSDFERQVSLIDARSNRDGVHVDVVLIRALITGRERYQQNLNQEAARLTGGKVSNVASEVPALQAWLKSKNVRMASVDKQSVTDALQGELALDVRRVLKLRQEASKGSLGKLDRMLMVMGKDERARGLLQYYGAGRTGRWAGRLIQVQNLPRRQEGVEPDEVLGIIQTDVAGLELFYPKPLDALSACLRGCLTALPGKKLAMIDLSQIEARVLAWLAGQADVLEVFRDSQADIYDYAARKIGSADRQLGKVVTLACGYGMGAVRFRETALDYGVVLNDNEARAAVQDWRGNNTAITKFWYAMDDAARRAISNAGAVQKVKGIMLQVRADRLFIRKPNGGLLVYHAPRIDRAGNEIHFMGVHQVTKRWTEQYTYGGKLVENVTQAVARDLVAEAVVRIDLQMGLTPVMTVHDELVYEVDGHGQGEAIQGRVNQAPGWAEGLPMASKLAIAFRYGK